ncbi:Sin-like protein conserved region-domain-containing protein [Apodospora peruviana]|uniref:Sin-like protein conserved region-domain-containing protein n=1 Tax=Apodospora peruviana TaxID=516989 RepID=A0AAE0I5V5_9PEZI|nr:Sin-like protein conserved region-domain-containing protein [Apodospora peruviana]
MPGLQSTPAERDPTNAKGPSKADNDDDDPIVATYRVFVKPALPRHRKIVALQYVNNTGADPERLLDPKVLELRLKPTAGMVEVDIPIDTSVAYDKSKGIIMGTALQKSTETKKGGSLGLAGGFGLGAAPPPRTGGRRGAGDDENVPLTWGEAVRQEKVLRKETLGGVRSAAEEYTRHMVGVFKGKNIHLTPVSSVVQLRPVHHHLDAAAEQERLARPTPGGAGGPGGAGAADKSAGRAIHMTLKAAMDDDGVSTETMADRLRAVQAEPWRRMEWVNDDSHDAWALYDECLFLRPDPSRIADQSHQKESAGKGKGKENADTTDAESKEDKNAICGDPELVSMVPTLRADWSEDQLLRAFSGIGPDDKKPGEEAIAPTQSQLALAAKMAAGKDKGKSKAPAVAVKPEPGLSSSTTGPSASPKRRPGRPAAATRSTRAKAGGGPSDAMKID